MFEFIDEIAYKFEELSTVGIIGAVLSVAVLLLFETMNGVLSSFLKFMSFPEKIIWGGVTFIASAIAGYLIFVKFLEE